MFLLHFTSATSSGSKVQCCHQSGDSDDVVVVGSQAIAAGNARNNTGTIPSFHTEMHATLSGLSSVVSLVSINQQHANPLWSIIFSDNSLSDVSRRDISYLKRLAQYHVMKLAKMPEHSDKFARSMVSNVQVELDFTKVPFQFNITTPKTGGYIWVDISVWRGNCSRKFRYRAYSEEILPSSSSFPW